MGNMDQIQDFKVALPTLKIRTVFDIGANVGRTVRAMARGFPKATIHAFEPVEGTYEILKKSVAKYPSIKCFKMAFGDVSGTFRMEAEAGSVKSRISDSAEGTEVEVRRGDEFCTAQGIERINFLKIDAEGYDLKVCHGFESMLKAGTIDLIQVECGLNVTNKLHIPFQSFRDYLDPLGYYLFRIYDQAGWPVARRGDAVFVSSQVRARNRRSKLARDALRQDRAQQATMPNQ